MPKFNYTAKSIDGKVKKGIADMESARELAQMLKEEGMILVQADYADSKKGFDFSFISKKVSTAEKMFMTRNLSIMVSTGLPLVKGFSILANQTKSKKLKNALLDISHEISKGRSLSDSFKRYPDIFSELFQTMIQIGEESGTLEEVLNILSLQLEKEKEMQSKVQKALVYPCILISIMVIIGICLEFFVLPKINVFFKSLDADLPLTTKIILGSGDFFQEYWIFIFMSIIIVALGFMTAIKTKSGKLFIDTFLLKIPFISSIVKKINSASLIRSLSSLLASGVALNRSLEIASGTVGNVHFKHALLESSQAIEKGKKLSAALQVHENLFPFGSIEMIEIGEETGKTSIILKKLAEFYEDEVADIADNLTVVIEPALIVFLGGAVGIFAVSIIGPLYSVLGNI